MKIVLLTGGQKESRRFPGKNYKILLDKELCKYTFEFIQRLNCKFDYEYYYFGDCPILTEIAKQYNIKVLNTQLKGMIEMYYIHRQLRADHYFGFSITSPIRDIDNIKRNMKICIDNKNINSAFTVFLNDSFDPKPTGSLSYFSNYQLMQRDFVKDKDSVCLPDPFPFDIDYEEDFEEIEKYLIKRGKNEVQRKNRTNIFDN